MIRFCFTIEWFEITCRNFLQSFIDHSGLLTLVYSLDLHATKLDMMIVPKSFLTTTKTNVFVFYPKEIRVAIRTFRENFNGRA